MVSSRIPHIVLIFVCVLMPSYASAGLIQGERWDENGNVFREPATVSIRSTSLTWYGNTYQTDVNPYFFSNLPTGTYEVGMQVPDGYEAWYSLCKNCIDHPDASYVRYGTPSPYSGGRPLPSITVSENEFVDLRWKFKKTNHASDTLFPSTTLNQSLTCNFPGMAVLPTTHTQSIQGSNVKVDLGISAKFGGIGTTLGIAPIRDGVVGNAVNLIESVSGAGSAWMTSTYGADANADVIFITNQGAGNMTEQWGYAGTFNGLSQTDWNPAYTDHYSRKSWSDDVNTSPCWGDAFRFNDTQSSMVASTIPTSKGSVVSVEYTHAVRARIPQQWSFFVADQALFNFRELAKQHNLRTYIASRDRTFIEGPITAYNTLISSRPEVTSSCADGSRQCYLEMRDAAYALQVWSIGGHDIGIVVHPGNSTVREDEFSTHIGIDRTALCSDETNPACGVTHHHSFLRYNNNPRVASGETRRFVVSYKIGTLEQLAELGYVTNTQALVPTNTAPEAALPDRGTVQTGGGSFVATPLLPMKTIVLPTLGSTTPFTTGARIQLTSGVNVRATAQINSTNRLCIQSRNTPGTVLQGPISGSGFTWWRVDFDRGCDGWAVGTYMEAAPAGGSQFPHCPQLTATLQRGSRDANSDGQVSELQRFLATRFSVPASDIITGYFGVKTEEWVRTLQRDTKISPLSGIVGPLTRTAIKRICSGT